MDIKCHTSSFGPTVLQEPWNLVIISKVKSMVNITGVAVTNDGRLDGMTLAVTDPVVPILSTMGTHGNPSFLGVMTVITHILGVENLHFSWFWGPRVVGGFKYLFDIHPHCFKYVLNVHPSILRRFPFLL